MKKLIVFDLDGTLIDSLGGIAASINRTRADYGFAPLARELISSFTGDGAVKLLERSFADVALPVPVEEAMERMIRNYADNPVTDTALYPGVAEGMKVLQESGCLLNVVSNKPVVVGEKILTHFGIMPYLTENIGGGSGFPLKPAPDALFYLMKKYQVSQENVWMVGDHHTDLNFALNGGVRSIFCKYGFGTQGNVPFTSEAESFSDCVEILSASLTEM